MGDPTSREFWDARAHSFSHYARRTTYCEDFLKRARILPGESVFDMGCGSGTLCIPLSDDGHRVFCADFSTRMLAAVEDVIASEGKDNLVCSVLDWNEDWTKRDLPVCDVALASRSLICADPAKALEKLDSVATRRVCVTVRAGGYRYLVPPSDIEQAKAAGPDAWRQTIDAVLDMGYRVQVDYIGSWAFIAYDKTALDLM